MVEKSCRKMQPSKYDIGIATMNTQQLKTPAQDWALRLSIMDRGRRCPQAPPLPEEPIAVNASDIISSNGVVTVG